MFCVGSADIYDLLVTDILWVLFVIGWVRGVRLGVLVARWPAVEEAAISASRVTSSF